MNHVFIFLSLLLLLSIFNQVETSLDNYVAAEQEGLTNLESLKDIVAAESGERKLAHCVLQLNRSNCNVNITAKYYLDCPVLKLTERLFPNNDMPKITGGFINNRIILTFLYISFANQNNGCNWQNGTVELLMNSKNKHVKIIDNSYLPLKVFSLKATWDLGIELLRSVDLHINGLFSSDTFGSLSPNIPRYDGVEIEITKLKGSTIFELKTINPKDIQLKHFLDDFELKVDSIVNGLSEKTKSKVSLNTMLITEAKCIGYIEPNVVFEIQVTGHRLKGSEAFQDAEELYVTTQKYHNQYEPSLAIFGKFGKFDKNNKLLLMQDLLKLSTITDIPFFNFFKDISSYGLVLSTDKMVVINIKEARDATNDFTCSECGAHYFPGLYIIFTIEDEFDFLQSSGNDSSSDKKIKIPQSPMKSPFPKPVTNITQLHKRTNIFKPDENVHRTTYLPYKSNKIQHSINQNFNNKKYVAYKNTTIEKKHKRSKILKHQKHHHSHHHHRHRFKRDDELKDILNSLNPGNLTINDTVPGAFEVDDAFEMDENNKPSEIPFQQTNNESSVNSSLPNSNSSLENFTKGSENLENVTKSSDENIEQKINNVTNTENIQKIDMNSVKGSTTQSPTRSPKSPKVTTQIIPSTTIKQPVNETSTTPSLIVDTTTTAATTTITTTTSSILDKTTNEPQMLNASNKDVFKFQGNTNRLLIIIEISESALNFRFPQNTEGSIADVTKFVSNSLKWNNRCHPYANFSTIPLYSLNKILLSGDKIELVVNLTQHVPLVTKLISISKYSGLTLTVSRDKNEKFDFKNALISGQGKETVIDQELKFAIVQEINTCSCVAQLFVSSIENITKEFNADLQTSEDLKTFPMIMKLPVEKIFIKTDIVGGKSIRMTGSMQFLSVAFQIEAHLIIEDKQRKLIVAIIGNQISLASVLQIVYKEYSFSWLFLEKGVLLISNGFENDFDFKDDLLRRSSIKRSGVYFMGEIGLPLSCENEISVDRFCEFFARKLKDFAGVQLQGSIYADRFNLTGQYSDNIYISDEIHFIKPTFTLNVNEKQQEIYVTGEIYVAISVGGLLQGKLSLHKSGNIALQVFSQASVDIFDHSFLHFKKFYGYTLLSPQKVKQIIQLQGSYVVIGNHGDEKSLPVVNNVGELRLSNMKTSYFHGVIKDISYSKLMEVFGQISKLRQIPFLNEARFMGVTKLFFQNTKEMNSTCFKLTGSLKISGSIYKTIVLVDETFGINFNIEFPVLKMSKDLVVIKKSKSDQNVGATLSYTVSLNPKRATTATMKAFVSAIGIEQEDVNIHVQQKSDTFLYFVFQMKGRIFDELELILSFKATDKANQGVKMIGQSEDIQSLKYPIKNHLKTHFKSLVLLYSKNYKLNKETMNEVEKLIQELGSMEDGSSRNKIKDIVIQITKVESELNENLHGIDKDCVEKCSKKPTEIQTLQEQAINNDVDLKSLTIQRITRRLAINVSCIAFCEVDKGISYKKACEELTIIRNLYPEYVSLNKRINKYNEFVNIAQKIQEFAESADDAFKKDGNIAKIVIDKYFEESEQEDWFEFKNIMIPEIDVGRLKGKLPCFNMKLKFNLYAQENEITKEICINGEVYSNIALHVFQTVFSQSDRLKLVKTFDELKGSYSKINRQISKLRDLIELSEMDENSELSSLEYLNKRDELFKPFINAKKKTEDEIYDRKFKKLIATEISQYTVHSSKTSTAMSQKSPWALLKASKNQPKSTSARNAINGTVPEDNDCTAVNLVATKYAHLTNILTDLVEAYEDGKTSFSSSRDELVDSLHLLDAKITNEANRTYYTKGELKDMIYWSVRVWKGIEEWVQETTRQFEEHNRNAISLFTEQLDNALSSERIPNAADYIQYLSRIGTSAIRKMAIERINIANVKTANGVVKSNLIKNNVNVNKKDVLAVWDKRQAVPFKKQYKTQRLVPVKSDPNYVLRRSKIQKRKRSHIAKRKFRKNAKKSLVEEIDNVIVKKDLNDVDMTADKKYDGLVYRQVDHVQNVAIALSTFLRNKDMTLDEAATRIPALRNEIRLLMSKASTCDTPA